MCLKWTRRTNWQDTFWFRKLGPGMPIGSLCAVPPPLSLKHQSHQDRVKPAPGTGSYLGAPKSSDSGLGLPRGQGLLGSLPCTSKSQDSLGRAMVWGAAVPAASTVSGAMPRLRLSGPGGPVGGWPAGASRRADGWALNCISDNVPVLRCNKSPYSSLCR